MISGPVGSGQAYWALIKIEPNDTLTKDQLEKFKTELATFLNDKARDLNATGRRANGVIVDQRIADAFTVRLVEKPR